MTTLVRQQQQINVGTLVDVEDSLRASTAGFQGVGGWLALVLGMGFGLLSLILFAMCVVFDLTPTAVFSMEKSAYLLPENAVGFGAIVGLMLTLLPSMIEMLGPTLLKRGVRVAWIPVALSVAFDAISDLPSCERFIATLQPLFESHFGVLAPLVHNLALALWLFAATCGWELLLAVSFVTMLQLLYQSRSIPDGRYR